MFYPNYLTLKNVSYKTYDFASFANGINTNYDEKLMPLKYSKNTYNFCFNNGALTNGLGISEFKVSYSANDLTKMHGFNVPDGVSVLGAWVYNIYSKLDVRYVDYLIVYCSNGKMYMGSMFMNTSVLAEIDGLSFSSLPSVVSYNLNGADVLLIGTKNEGLFVLDSRYTPFKVDSAPNITSMAVHYERLFVTIDGDDKRTLYFSDDLDPTNWNLTLSEGGFINMMDERGVLNKVVSFNDYLYVFRDFGIARVSAYASQEDFYVSQLYTSSGRIYPNTITMCGDVIIFLADDGIYSFNGSSTSKISLNIDKLFENVSNDHAVGTFNNGCYYLTCKLNFDDEKVGCEAGDYVNNVLLELNLNTGEINLLRGVDIINIQSVTNTLNSKVVACFKNGEFYSLGEINKCGCVFENSLKKVWHAPETDFGVCNREKIITNFYIYTKSDMKVIIKTNNKIKEFSIKGKDKISTIKPNLKGYSFEVSFVCENNNAYISMPQVRVGFL